MKWRRPKKGGRYIAWVRGAFRRQAAKPLRPLVPSSRLRAAGGGIARCGLADNRLAELAGWDDELLALELKDLTDAGFDATLTGFDDSEVAALVASLDEGGGEPEQAEEVPEPPAQAVTQPGDLWLIGPHRLLCGDCGTTTPS